MNKDGSETIVEKATSNGHQKIDPDAPVDIRKGLHLRAKPSFDKAAEACFGNIQWSNVETDPLDEQVMVFPFNTNYLFMVVMDIVQMPRHREEGQECTGYVWRVQSYLVNIKRNDAVSASRYTRNQKRMVEELAVGALYGVNTKRASFAYDQKNIKYVGYVACTQDDLKVIEALLTAINDDLSGQIVHPKGENDATD